MAAIEKRCEVSDIYAGPDMYRHKKNNIQVLPEYRKLFKGKNYTLILNVENDSDEVIIDSSTSFLLWVPEVPGQVRGFYYSHYYDKSDLIKKMKKLLGVKKLHIHYSLGNKNFIYQLSYYSKYEFGIIDFFVAEVNKDNLRYKIV